MTSGPALRNAGQDAAIAADVAAHRGAGEYIREAMGFMAEDWDVPWTCDDVREFAADFAKHDGNDFNPSTNLLPSLIGVAVGKGEIVRLTGDVNSTRRSRHASKVGRYLGAKYAPTP